MDYNIYPTYKRIHYKYDILTDKWFLYDNYEWGNVGVYDASCKRLDECFEHFLNLLNGNN